MLIECTVYNQRFCGRYRINTEFIYKLFLFPVENYRHFLFGNKVYYVESRLK